MTLLTPEQTAQLLLNGESHDADHFAVLTFDIFLGNGQDLCYMLTELDPANLDQAYGLCDPGDGQPKMGYVTLSQIESVTRAMGKEIIVDPYFEPSYPISVYREAAREAGFITTHPQHLEKAESRLKGLA